MPQLISCFQAAGFTGVSTVLSSGNVIFDSRSKFVPSIERKIEAVLMKNLGRTFFPIVRSFDALKEMLQSDPYAEFSFPDHAKRVVSFLRKPPVKKLAFPIERDGASLFLLRGTEVFSVYVPHPKGPAFMNLIEKAFGDEVTTRTWETVRKCVSS
jgi:uncharacterized protein (DUF1697 family)